MGHLTYEQSKAAVYKTTGILSAVTIIEVGCALYLPAPDWLLAIMMIGMTLLKAFYIVGVFMHLKYEVNNFILTVLIPLTMLFWGIFAFLYEGDWLLNSRETMFIDWVRDYSFLN